MEAKRSGIPNVCVVEEATALEGPWTQVASFSPEPGSQMIVVLDGGRCLLIQDATIREIGGGREARTSLIRLRMSEQEDGRQ